ncbi:hypothetical protein FRB95_007290 [Tulasnella sp. JGI-2019a]|nr:hypothetical protein FRB93_011156 [Tulasnella sp. JGI-2019a]KAG9036995.1 hypothetical protein FRB95_007290 [Tulasnella sp. JGI-2019a]
MPAKFQPKGDHADYHACEWLSYRKKACESVTQTAGSTELTLRIRRGPNLTLEIPISLTVPSGDSTLSQSMTQYVEGKVSVGGSCKYATRLGVGGEGEVLGIGSLEVFIQK